MFKIKPIFKFNKFFPFIKIHWFILDEEKFQFVDDILKQLAEKPEFQNEEYIAPIVCNNISEIEIFGKIYTPKDFIPQGKERLYFRIATMFLEEKKLIIVDREDPYDLKYLISYEGLILSKNGGVIEDLRNKYIRNFLEKFAWTVAILTFLFTTIIQCSSILYQKENVQCVCHFHLSVKHKQEAPKVFNL